MLKPGVWTLFSKKDPRWNCSGEDLVGGLVLPEKCKEKFEELKKELGNPPDDLE